ACDGPGLQEGLELPRACPLVPVRLEGLTRPDERAVASLGPQVGVDAERAARHLHQGAGVSLPHEHHVDVARVVQLVAAELPHADDGERRPSGEVPRRAQHVVGEARQVGAHVLERGATGEIARRDPEQLVLLPPAHRVGIGCVEQRPGGEVGEDVEREVVGQQQAGEEAAGADHGDGRVEQLVVVGETGARPFRPFLELIDGARHVRGRRRALDGLAQAVHTHASSLTGPISDRPQLRPEYACVMARIRVAACQIDTVVGDLDGNAARVLAALEQAEAAGADVALFPELAITGYPPEDLLLKPGFVADNLEVLERVAAATKQCAAVIGFVDADRDLYNAAAVCAGGKVVGRYHKRLLPNYAVFDEQRYFAPGIQPLSLFLIGGVRCGVSICEDAWSPTGPIADQAAGGAELVLNINASPYYAGRLVERERMLATRAADSGCVLAYVNQVGGQDELVFDGASFVMDANGEVIASAPQF